MQIQRQTHILSFLVGQCLVNYSFNYFIRKHVEDRKLCLVGEKMCMLFFSDIVRKAVWGSNENKASKIFNP